MHMKTWKPTIIVAALAFLVWLIPLVSAAGTREISAKVLATVSTTASVDISGSAVFSSGNTKDLYKRVHEKVKRQGSDMAVAKTLTRRPLSKEELLAVLPGTNINALLTEPDPKKNLTQQEVNARLNEFYEILSEEKELADMQVLIEMEATQTEIFSNGDLQDSGFDLIADLELIETILFGKPETALGGSGPGAPAGANEIGPDSGGAGGGGQGGQGGTPAGGSGGASGSGSSAEPGSETDVSIDAAEKDAFCPADQSFHDAVKKAREKEKEEEKKKITGSGEAGSKDDQGGSSGGGSGKNTGGTGEEIGPLISEKASDWSRPQPCNDVFCLKVQAIYKKASSYQSKDNCIACHFEKINDAFKKTVDKTLLPSKATGNTAEGSKCKRQMLGLKWNLVLIPEPIVTPPNDDLIPKGDFIKNAIKFYEKYFDNPGRCSSATGGATGGACKPDESTVKIPEDAITQAPEGTEQSKVLEDIRTRIANKKLEAEKLIEESHLEADANAFASQFQVILQEIDTMNTYFKSFMTLYKNILPKPNEDGEETPCSILLTKPVCT